MHDTKRGNVGGKVHHMDLQYRKRWCSYLVHIITIAHKICQPFVVQLTSSKLHVIAGD